MASELSSSPLSVSGKVSLDISIAVSIRKKRERNGFGAAARHIVLGVEKSTRNLSSFRQRKIEAEVTVGNIG